MKITQSAIKQVIMQKIFRLYGHCFFLKFFPQKDDDNSQSNGYLLIKKPRAVLVSNTIVKLTQSVTAIFSSNNIFFSLEPLISFVQSIDPLPEDGYYLSFSGLSPPFNIILCSFRSI